MSQSGSSTSASPPMRVYKLSHALVTAAVCLVMGLGFWWLYGQIGKTRLGLGGQFDEFKRDTDLKMQELPKSQAELRRRIEGVESILTDAKESLDVLQQTVDHQRISDAMMLADTAELYFHGEKIRKRLKVLTDEFGQWNTRPDLLLTNDDGKRIAAMPELVSRFVTTCEELCTTETDLAAYESRLERIMTPVTRAYKNEDAGFELTESWSADLEELEKEVDEAFKRFDEQRLDISAMLKRAPEQAPDDALTLLDAINAERERRRDEKAKVIEETLREERLKHAQMIANAKAEAERLVAEANAKVERTLGEQTARNITEEAENIARRERDRIRQRQEELAREQLEQEFERDKRQIQTFLGVLMIPGYRQPGRQGSYATSTEKGPVSLSALKAAGALSPDIHGIAAFTLAVERQDRPHSGWPRLKVSSDRLVQAGLGIYPVGPDQEFVQNAQTLLKKYGELMVEKGMLAP